MPRSPEPRAVRATLLLLAMAALGACNHGSRVTDARATASDGGATAQPGARPSSFRACPDKAPGGCDYGEACDFTTYDLLCAEGTCEGPQTGDSRCHRVCEDGTCAAGETCERRTVHVSDTGTKQLPLCLCAGSGCPVRGPEGAPWPAEGGLASWRQERAMPVDLYHHAAAASADRLFVSGGLHVQQSTPSGALMEERSEVYSAGLQPDGGLGAWMKSGTLPQPRIHHGMAVLAGRLFIAGGQQGGGFTASVLSAPLREDGTLGPWREEAPLPQPRAWHSLVAHDGALWVVGGSLDAAYFTQGTREVLRARLSAGSGAQVSRWEAVTAPAALHYDQAAASAKGRLYTVDARGQLSSVATGPAPDWRAEPTPPWKGTVDFAASGQHTLRLAATGDTLVLALPRGLTLTARLYGDGSVRDWRPASRLYDVTSAFATASAGGRVYVFGGASDTPAPRRVPGVWSTHAIRETTYF